MPYILKQFIDVVSQPGMVFGFDAERGYTGLLTGRKAAVVYTSAVYGPGRPPAFGSDFQAPYLRDWLSWAGIDDVTEVAVPAQPGHRRRRHGPAERARRRPGPGEAVLTLRALPASRCVAGRRQRRQPRSPSQSRVPANRSTSTDQAATSSSNGGAGASRSGSGRMIALTRLPSGLAEPSASVVSVVAALQGRVDEQLDRQFELLGVDRLRALEQALVQTVHLVGVLGTGQHGGLAVGDRLAISGQTSGRPARASASASVR